VTVPTTTSIGTVPGGDLRSKLIPPPSGYQVNTQSGVTNGPITPAKFDENVGQPGAAESFHLVSGYDQSYLSTVSAETIEILLFRFTSSDGAVAFARVAPKTGLVTELDRTEGTIPSIPGSVLIDSTKPGNDGFYVHQILAQKGNFVVAMEYATDTAGPLPTFAANIAAQQYTAL
jgi:hypothetical protein